MSSDNDSVIVSLSQSQRRNSGLGGSGDISRGHCPGPCRWSLSHQRPRVLLSASTHVCKSLRWNSTEYGRRHNVSRIVMSVVAWELGPGYTVKSNNITGSPIHMFSPPKMETFRRHARKLYGRPTCVFLYSQCIRVSPS
ncbi:hypothetical protein L6452_15761 [Arctium lappa]|uniref:Uncharacterized protein n=1 Tax=Arctium lappa TaxID=4217 RepID=A0ACB9CPF9_ARCLA|nr:hypothetical protein L6452_15761 [Arctium lappa]